jgi:Transposase DDE domain group 1
VVDQAPVVAHVGAVVLAELADRVGLTGGLGRWANRGLRSGAYDRGRVLRDLVVMLADGGDCVSDLAALRDQPLLFGRVASTATAWRVVAEEVAADPKGLAALWGALAVARERAWAVGAAPVGPLVVDFDASLVTAHSDKQGAAPTYKGGFGLHPLLACLDRGDGTGEVLAGVLRPGNAGANTTADHVHLLTVALLAIPAAVRARGPILVRSDAAGATHGFVEAIVAARHLFSVGFDCDARVRAAILATPERAWQPALDVDGRPRDGAWVCELTLDLAAAGWPAGTRAICRRERPHPGAIPKMTFTDAAGHRFQVFITNQPDPDIRVLEARHRAHARVEDRIRTAKATGLRNLPFGEFAANHVWLALSAIAQTLVCWAQVLLLDGELRVAEPKTLRYRLWHAAGRITRHARRLVLHLPATWPWAAHLVRAFARLRALPTG